VSIPDQYAKLIPVQYIYGSNLLILLSNIKLNVSFKSWHNVNYFSSYVSSTSISSCISDKVFDLALENALLLYIDARVSFLVSF